MLSLRDIKRRIKSVEGIRQITRAMEMVSATKLSRARQRIESGRPYTSKMDEILAHLSEAVKAGICHHPLMDPKEEVNNVMVLVIASDKGLCGSYNSNLFRRVRAHCTELVDSGLNPSLFLIGKKIFKFFKKRDHEILEISADHLSIDQKLPVKLITNITEYCTDAYLEGRTDRVDMIYTEFHSALRYKVKLKQFLPIIGLLPTDSEEGKQDSDEEPATGSLDYIFEPDPDTLFSVLIPKYAGVMVFRMLADGLASEHATRMNSMHNATENAGDMIKTLTLMRNKARQTAITKELLEIVSGAEALQG